MSIDNRIQKIIEERPKSLTSYTFDFDKKFVYLTTNGTIENPTFKEQVFSKETGDLVISVFHTDPELYKQTMKSYHKEFDDYYLTNKW